MTTRAAQDAIALLIDLAQRGEIDPWDVDVIKVIDRFLSELATPEATIPPSPTTDLSQSGQAFLWASMLVLFKADTLEQFAEPEAESDPLDCELTELSAEASRTLPQRLERHLRRRPTAPPPRRRPVTLQELIDQIEQLAAEWEKVPSRSSRPRTQSRREAAHAIAQLAHSENLTEMAAQLDRFLTSQLPVDIGDQDWLDWEQLLAWWTSAQTTQPEPDQSSSPDRVGVFWALLLLSAQSKVELSQQEFYKDLKIRRLTSSLG